MKKHNFISRSRQVPTKKNLTQALEGLSNNLQDFIDLSFRGDTGPLHDWVKDTIDNLNTRCWEINGCTETGCPAYRNECGRCWLIAGTMCNGNVQGKFAEKYQSCTNCQVYLKVVDNDPVIRLREQVLALIHSLRMRQEELAETRSELKVLSGLLPICMNCKKIRDDQGYWNQLEKYIHQHSEARFSHGICPDCMEKLYPGLLARQKDKKDK